MGDYENLSFKIVEGREFSGLSTCRVLESQRKLLLDCDEGRRPCSGPVSLLLLFCITKNNENQNKSEGSITCGLGLEKQCLRDAPHL